MAAAKSRQIKFIIVAVLVLAPILFVLFWQAKDKRAVRKYKQQLLAAGEKLTIAELSPRLAAPENNNASSILRLQSKRRPNSILTTNAPRAMQMVAPGKAAVGWAQPAIVETHVTNTWEEELAAFDLESPTPEWVEQMIAHP